MRICLQCQKLFEPNPLCRDKVHQKFCTDKCKDRYWYLQTKGTKARCIKNMLGSAKHRAKVQGTPFSINKKDIRIPKRCPVFRIELKINTGKFRDDSPSLDKIEPSKGYVPGNVKVISNKANRLKNKMSLKELRALVRYVESIPE